MLININTLQRIEPYELRSLYPNTSWPIEPSDAALADIEYRNLFPGEQPAVTDTQKVIDNGSEQREDGKWYIVWAVVDKTPEEIFAESPRVFEIQMRLPQIDPESVPLIRAVVTNKATQEQIDKLAELEQEFLDLTAELKALTPVPPTPEVPVE
jgi:hypothetical protein